MQSYPIPMVPGPVRVPERILDVYREDYGSADLESDYLELYNQVEASLQQIFATKNRVTIQTGEGMLGLWGALKSVIRPGERVLAVATGVFGYGISEMAQSIGAEVRTVSLPYDQTIQVWDAIEAAIVDFRPKMITVVHCETPSGTLNPIEELGRLKRKHGVPLLYADVVASLGGAPVETDAWAIDLALGGSQKVLSAPPSMTMVAVSPAAWEIIQEVNYPGYDALLPFVSAQEKFYFPYTPYWQGLATLKAAADILLEEGLQNCFNRHTSVAQAFREGLQAAGLELFPASEAVPAPTVTAVKVPANTTWPELDQAFRAEGLVVGGSYGPLAGKVFRLGHMGSQATHVLADQALGVIRKVCR
jgi:aspartate aminotransferase-like enzyme